MKTTIRLFLLILISLFASASFAQNLATMRVFFDNEANGYQYFDLPDAASIDQPFTVDVSALSPGMHRLYVEVMDSNGIWSLYDSKMVQLAGGLQMAVLNAAEYFFDTDPGLGEGIQIALSGNTINQDFDLSLDGLSNGVHLLYMRVRDGDNQWSLTHKELIHVVGSMMQALVAAEYFYDVDPGLGQGNPIDLAGFTSGDLQLEIGDLQTGVHQLYIRVLDASGIWSLSEKRNIIVTNPVQPTDLVAAEYYFDTDPGEGNAYPLEIPQQALVDGDFQLDIPANLTGNHTVCIRVRNGAGFWSDVACQPFSICNLALPEIVATGENCQSQPIVLALSNANYDSILWSTDENTASIQVTEPGEYTATVTENGCSTTVTYTADFQLMPELVYAVSGPVCPGSTQLITVNDDFDTYLWDNESSLPSLEVTTSGIYHVQVTSGNCSNEAFIQVDFYQPENPVIQISGTACEGNILTLSVDNSLTNIQWNDNSTGAALQATESGTYSLTALDEGCSVSAEVNVTFDMQPQYTVETSGGPCEEDPVLLSITPATYDFEWFDNTTTSSNTVTTSGDYAVTITNGSCSVQEVFTVELIQLPQPEIITNVNALACDLVGYSYQWYLNGEPISGATSQIYNTTQSGFYSVEISDGNCTQVSAITNHVYVSLTEILPQGLHIYPVPAQEVLYITSREVILQYTLHDVSGKQIMSSSANASGFMIDVSALAAGIYHLRLRTEKGEWLREVVKE